MIEVWQEALKAVAPRIDPGDLHDFVVTLEPVGKRERTLIIEAPSPRAADVVRQRYKALIEAALIQASAGSIGQIDLQVRGVTQRELFPPPPPLPEPPERRDVRRSNLLPKYTFNTFVVGASNQFAHAACKAVASQPGYHYNPLFIYGGVGLGKTHLVNAIGHQILDQNASTRVLYLSSESFMNELIAALRRDRMDDFRSRFRRIDVLILDDVQFL